MSFSKEINDRNLEQELQWLRECLHKRIEESTHQVPFDFESFPGPMLIHNGSPYAEFIVENKLTQAQRLVMILSLGPDLDRGFLSSLVSQKYDDCLMAYLDLVLFENRLATMPSVNTALFIMAGKNAGKKLAYENIFSSDDILYKKRIIYLDAFGSPLPWQHHALRMEQDNRDFLLNGVYTKPVFSVEFPASEITTQLEQEDLILFSDTKEGIDQVLQWLKHKDSLYKIPEYSKKVKPGARVLFYGPPGTGKTESASLLGKRTGKTVYRIDLSKVVSKYIGETEKNLSRLFDKAESKGWILFFDEGDSLFGKRTNKVESANDLHANQQISFLLQRIETYDGLVILSTNLKENIDEAFYRRFDFIVPFYNPANELLLQVWQRVFPSEYVFADDVNLPEISSFTHYAFSPAEVTSIMKFVLMTLEETSSKLITEEVLMNGIRRELARKGKPFIAVGKNDKASLQPGTPSIISNSFSDAIVSQTENVSLSELNERLKQLVDNKINNRGNPAKIDEQIQELILEISKKKDETFNRNFA